MRHASSIVTLVAAFASIVIGAIGLATATASDDAPVSTVLYAAATTSGLVLLGLWHRWQVQRLESQVEKRFVEHERQEQVARTLERWAIVAASLIEDQKFGPADRPTNLRAEFGLLNADIDALRRLEATDAVEVLVELRSGLVERARDLGVQLPNDGEWSA